MFTFFDTETTGLPLNYNAPVTQLHNWPRMVQIAWLCYNLQGKLLERHEFIIKPEGFIIPPEASKVHGITTEIAHQKGNDLATVLRQFALTIERSDALIAHNISFDERIVGAEFLRKNIPNKLFDKPRICTMKSSANYCKLPGKYGNYKWPNLTELHIRLFGKAFDNAHDALADVVACANCFFELQKLKVL